VGAQAPFAIPCRHLVPLQEIIAEALGQGPDTKGVLMEYQRMISSLKNEFNILLDLTHEEIAKITLPKIAEGIIRVREGKLNIVPGYDGVFGKISIFSEAESKEQQTEQLGLF
jgi:PHP family Zn ribbon phosphoesterase